MTLQIFFLLQLLDLLKAQNTLNINIQSNYILNTNGYTSTSPYLLGITAYANIGLLNNKTRLTTFHDDFGINVIGWGGSLTDTLLPKDSNEAIQCCNTTEGLVTYLNSGEGCENYNKNNYDEGIWNSDLYYDTLDLTSFIYLIGYCSEGNYPTLWHCAGNDTGGGVPVNDDAWWTNAILGYVNCTLQARPDIKYFHLWNEPNAHFWKYGYNGTYYAEFYQNVTGRIKAVFPDIKMSGPVTYDPPADSSTWEGFFVPVFKMASQNPGLLDYVDFHSYTYYGVSLSQWDYILANVHSTSIYYQVLNDIYTSTNPNYIRNLITETNVDVYTDTNSDNLIYHWYNRTLPNALQILCLSYTPDKFYQRHLFDLGADTFSFYNSIQDKNMHILFRNISNKNMVYFQFDGPTNIYNPRFTSKEVYAQVLFDLDSDNINILLVNNDLTNANTVFLTDSADQLNFNDVSHNILATEQTTLIYGNDITYNTTNGMFGIVMPPLSIASIYGKFGGSPPEYIYEIEFLPTDTSNIMQKMTENDESYSIDINIEGAENITSDLIFDVYLKIGMTENALSYVWNIKVTSGDTTYLVLNNQALPYQYMEVSLDSSIYNVIKDGTTFNVALSGTKGVLPPYDGSDNARLAFVSIGCVYRT